MSLSYTVVSIGALSRNRFWNETEPRRMAHATTTLVQEGDRNILVDPGLPEQVLAQRLEERTGLKPEQIDVVFLTNFRPVHRRALPLFSKATWLMHEPEIQAVREHLDQLAGSLRGGEGEDELWEAGDLDWQDAGPMETEADLDEADAGPKHEHRELEALVRHERMLLDHIRPAGEKLGRQVHLFPSVGPTPGAAGLLLTETSRTVVIAGDAVVSRDYFEAGRVFEQVYDLETAQSALRDVMEVADIIVPGHDNLFVVTGR